MIASNLTFLSGLWNHFKHAKSIGTNELGDDPQIIMTAEEGPMNYPIYVGNRRIFLASSRLAISLPSSLAIRAAFSTGSALLLAMTPLET